MAGDNTPTPTYALGKDCIIKIIAAGGTTAAILGQRSCTVSFTRDMIETTVKGDFPDKMYAPGWCGWTVQVTGAYYIDGGTKNQALLATAGSLCDVDVVIGNETWQGQGYISSISVNGEYTDVAAYDITIQGSDGLDVSPQ